MRSREGHTETNRPRRRIELSDQSDVRTNVQESSDAPRTKPARTKKATFSIQDLAAARLRKRGVKNIDSKLSDECKVVRGILRSQFGFVTKNDATVKKAKDAYNDRKPWPTNMNRHTFDIVVNGKKPGRKS
jgi:hypothetical protein